MLDLKPEYAFQHKDSGLPLPKGLRPEAPVVVDVTVRGCCCWRAPAHPWQWLPGLRLMGCCRC